MADDRKRVNGSEDNSGPKPDPETTHTTDPQEHMEGPVSSLMHNTGEAFDTDESQKEADEERDSKL
jgi:hypothetical protein